MGEGGRVPPGASDWEIFADVSGKKEARKKGKRGENWEEKKENWKREGGKFKMEVGKVIKRVEDFFFFFLAFHFWKWQKFVLGLPKWEFSTWKKHFTPGKNQEKWLCPLIKIYLLRPWAHQLLLLFFYPKLLNFVLPKLLFFDFVPFQILCVVAKSLYFVPCEAVILCSTQSLEHAYQFILFTIPITVTFTSKAGSHPAEQFSNLTEWCTIMICD